MPFMAPLVPPQSLQNPAGHSAWQEVYKQLELNKIEGVTSYQVNGNLFIVVPLHEEEQ